MKRTRNLNSIESDLIAGMEEFVSDLKADKPLTGHRLVLNLEPQSYTADQVKATRQLLQLSQAMFAKFLGASTKSVSAWEQGREPPDMACRFMDEIQRNPNYFRQRIRDSLSAKSN
jgi:putative transcriptional regulator